MESKRIQILLLVLIVLVLVNITVSIRPFQFFEVRNADAYTAHAVYRCNAYTGSITFVTPTTEMAFPSPKQ
jgi:hypothetical protein